MEEKDPELEVWEETKQWSMDDFKEIYRWLDIHFDHDFYESDVDEEGRQMVLEGEKSTFIRSEGAIGIDLETENLVFLCCSSPTATPFTRPKTALARRKFDQFSVDRSVMWSVPNRPCTSNRFLRH